MTLLAQVAQATTGVTSDMVVFWVFGVLALGSAIAVITLRNVVHAALMLVLNFLAVSGLYLTLQSPFLSIIQVLVYGGAIMVLFLFVIMLLGVDRDDLLHTDVRTRALAIAGGALLAGAVLFAFVGPYTSAASVCAPDSPAPGAGEAQCVGLADAYGEEDGAGAAFLGRSLFTTYTYPFELSALLLTVATIGAVILARRKDLAPEDEDELPGANPSVEPGAGTVDPGDVDPGAGDPRTTDPGTADPRTVDSGAVRTRTTGIDGVHDVSRTHGEG